MIPTPHSGSHSGSLLRRLQVSFALATLAVVGLLALFMDVALRRSFEAEDAIVMEAQADALARPGGTRKLPGGDPERRPEKADWRLLDGQGRVLVQSAGMENLPSIFWPIEARSPLEVKASNGEAFSILVRAIPEGTLQLAMDRSHEQTLVAGFRRTLGAAIGLAALLAALLGRWVAKRGLRPLHLIAIEAADIAPSRLDHRLHGEHFPEELGELVATLNGTLARLQEAFDRLARMASELAHELRTPLQNLRAEAEGILLGPNDPEASREALGSVLEECDRLARLIEQMLFLANTDNPSTAIEKKSVDVSSLLQSVADFFEAEAAEAQVNLRVESAAGLTISGDEPLLSRALHNLAANALRHTPAGGTIILGANPSASEVRFFVRDDGPGLPLEVLAHLGERWIRGPYAQGPGLGLGLAIVKGIAQLHGGKLQAQNQPGGGGTGAEVCIWLPRFS
ncbi:MAG: HAMP domain-containing protein [Holophagaceae bacterium]|nr:HAMP domain-containing protein [Holophagaceae bacterium]